MLIGASREGPKGLGYKSPRSFKGAGRCQSGIHHWMVEPFWPGLSDPYRACLNLINSTVAPANYFLGSNKGALSPPCFFQFT